MNDAVLVHGIDRSGDLDGEIQPSGMRSAPRASRAARVSPSRYCITKKTVPSCRPT